jgi:KipI family sensor histidine kinase inhibitor
MTDAPLSAPLLLPLGDQAMLVRFGDSLSNAANLAAAGFARRVLLETIPGVVEIVPGLVSVLLRYADGTSFKQLAGEVQMRLGAHAPAPPTGNHTIGITFDGEDLAEVATTLSLTPAQFIDAHNTSPLRVLATGFAPGFVYCGFHTAQLEVPRRQAVRPMVPAGTVLFAARQTTIAATPIRTGWNVIGRTTFRNFDATATPPTKLSAGDTIRFEVAR